MEKDSYAQDDYAKASEHLRLALSLLSKHQIPPSPLNFRLGYDYVAGRDQRLKAALDEIIEKSEEPLGKDLDDVYCRFFVQDDQALEKMRQELRRMIEHIRGELERSGGNLANYIKTLDRFSDVLDSSPPDKMSQEVRKVADDTRSMERVHHLLESNMTKMMSEMETMRRELEQVKEEVMTDALTGISNRKAFDSALENIIEAAQKQRAPFCILLADIDHFKAFNDTFGHLVGDKVIRFVALSLKRCLKGKDMAARYGGEEFAVILPDTALKGAEVIAEQIRKAVSSGVLKDKKINEDYGRITISIGVAQFRSNELPHDLVRRADNALYLAKNRGRDRVEQAA